MAGNLHSVTVQLLNDGRTLSVKKSDVIVVANIFRLHEVGGGHTSPFFQRGKSGAVSNRNFGIHIVGNDHAGEFIFRYRT